MSELDAAGGSRCPVCGKVRYSSRRAARLAIRRIRSRRSGHMSPYRCGDFWHVGHTPSAVVRGDITRDDLVVNERPGEKPMSTAAALAHDPRRKETTP